MNTLPHALGHEHGSRRCGGAGTRPCGPALRCLVADESAFIDAAFRCILPEAKAEGLEVAASAYVDAKLSGGAGSAGPDLRLYRCGIAEAQALCERTRGQRFQSLPLWQQLAVLAEIEHPAAALGVARCLLDLLSSDAAEAYFEAAPSAWASVPEARRAVAA